ncbi:hypothetical protein MP228_004846 [Amoeboaphelidium protococcarum]|nr:hypothetical protein MP228_004846 [Amoeboaphelidium protococcarum]
MFVSGRNPYFKTQSGKVFNVNLFTMQFVDPKLEQKYVQYLLLQFLPQAKTGALFIILCDVLLVIMAKFNQPSYDTFQRPTLMYVLLCAPTMWGSRFFQQMELLFALCMTTVVDIATTGVTIIGARFPPAEDPTSKLLHYPYTNLLWIIMVSLFFSLLLRRRFVLTVISFIVSMALHVLYCFLVYPYSAIDFPVRNNRAIIMCSLMAFVVYSAQIDILSRSAFLTTRELESWRVDMADVELKQLIGVGTFGEVYFGRWRGFEVAVKKVQPNRIQVQKGGEAMVDGKVRPLIGCKSKLSVSLRDLYHLFFVKVLESGTNGISRRDLDAFEKEMRLLCTLKHPNVINFLGAYIPTNFLDGEVPLLITQFAHKGSLFDYFYKSENRPISLKQKFDFAIQSAEGLHYLHSQEPQIIHRDFKSLNILIDQYNCIKICDFGLCDFTNSVALPTGVKSPGSRPGTPKVSDKDPRNVKLNHKIVGSVPWTACEIFMQTHSHTVQSDIYSLGVVLWEIFSEQHPYLDELSSGSTDVKQIVSWICFKDYRPQMKKYIEERYKAQLPAELPDLIRLMWHGDPNQRPQWSNILNILNRCRKVVTSSQSSSQRAKNSKVPFLLQQSAEPGTLEKSIPPQRKSAEQSPVKSPQVRLLADLGASDSTNQLLAFGKADQNSLTSDVPILGDSTDGTDSDRIKTMYKSGVIDFDSNIENAEVLQKIDGITK